jgi:hypothetical protein
VTTPDQAERREREALADQATRDAAAIVAASYARELAGHRLTARQRDLQARAERLARALGRIDRQRRGRP